MSFFMLAKLLKMEQYLFISSVIFQGSHW